MYSYKLENITYTYPNRNKAAVENLSITLEKGTFTLVSGVSGSGKSTLGKIIKGIVPNLYGGTFSGNGQGEAFGYVLQDPEKQMLMSTVEGELAFGMENLGLPYNTMRKRVAEILDYIGLSHYRKAETRTLSGGQQQKLAIGCAIAMGFHGLILDEPTGQLDPVSSSEILTLIRRLNEEKGMTILLIEQKIDTVLEMVDRILFMSEGQLMFDGHPQAFVNFNNKSTHSVLSSFTLAFKKAVDEGGLSECPLSIKSARQMIANTYDLSSLLALERHKTQVESPMNSKILSVDGFDDPVLSLSNILFSYDKSKKHLMVRDFVLKQSSITGIIGENGSGKSTLLKVMAGVLKPHKGSVKKPTHIGYLSQNPNDYFFEATLEAEIKQVLKMHQLEWSSKLIDLLDLLKISDYLSINPRDLSGGERQRAALAIVLASQPKLLLLDEPTRGLNKGLKRQLVKLLKTLKHKGLSIAIVSHDMELIADLTDHVAIISSGQLEVVDQTEKLMSDGLFYVSDFGKLFSSFGLSISSSQAGLNCLLNLKEKK
jgi:energy-coupling factor transport system ATP-binding protein